MVLDLAGPPRPQLRVYESPFSDSSRASEAIFSARYSVSSLPALGLLWLAAPQFTRGCRSGWDLEPLSQLVQMLAWP